MVAAFASGKVTLPSLGFDYEALSPFVSKDTLQFHHDKHHAKYVSVTNELIANTDMEEMDVIEIIRKSYAEQNQVLFNNAAQSYNHAFFWQCMKPQGGGEPRGVLADMISMSFGSFEHFSEQFSKAAAAVFGSGWVWLVHNSQDDKLSVMKTIGADCPITQYGLTPLLALDVWEHAYYLDYQNLRPKYIDNFMKYLVDWEFVGSNLPTKNVEF